MNNRYIHFIFLFLFVNSSNGFDRSVFYRASSFWQTPRFEEELLTTWQLQLSGGSTKCGRNKRKKKVNILSVYNSQCIKGNFDLFELNLNLYQNFKKGLFCHFHMPVEVPDLYSYRTKHRPFSILLMNGESGLGDSTLFLGYTVNYENTTYLDFIDFAIQAGPLFPTGKKKNATLPFDIPYGYNGHWGIALCADFAIGALDWLTIGTHADGVLLLNKKRSCENQIITTKPGSVWRIGGYIKADHFCGGLSALLAFAYEQKGKDHLYLSNRLGKSNYYDQICHNGNLKKWFRSLVIFLMEYDFSQEKIAIGPYVQIYYSKNISGKRIFQTNMAGGLIAIDIGWTF